MNSLQTEQCVAFESLPHNEQMLLLQNEGVYIGKLKEGKGTKLLYQYSAIYVEVIYTKHRNLVQEVNCFTDTTILDTYFSSGDFVKGEGV